jgi:hypothetical protein
MILAPLFGHYRAAVIAVPATGLPAHRRLICRARFQPLSAVAAGPSARHGARFVSLAMHQQPSPNTLPDRFPTSTTTSKIQLNADRSAAV